MRARGRLCPKQTAVSPSPSRAAEIDVGSACSPASTGLCLCPTARESEHVGSGQRAACTFAPDGIGTTQWAATGRLPILSHIPPRWAAASYLLARASITEVHQHSPSHLAPFRIAARTFGLLFSCRLIYLVAALPRRLSSNRTLSTALRGPSC